MPSSDLDLFIFAAEASGDLHGEHILRLLLKDNPSWRIGGVGGPKMRPLMTECLLPMETFQVMGFVDVFKKVFHLIRRFYQVRRAILHSQPKLVFLIDYAALNMHMAISLRKKRFSGKICHYICPSVWAWKKQRIGQMASTLDLLLTIFPFEPPLFAHTSLKVYFMGHPLLTRIEQHVYQPLHFADSE